MKVNSKTLNEDIQNGILRQFQSIKRFSDVAGCTFSATRSAVHGRPVHEDNITKIIDGYHQTRPDQAIAILTGLRDKMVEGDKFKAEIRLSDLLVVLGALSNHAKIIEERDPTSRNLIDPVHVKSIPPSGTQ